MKIAIDDKSLNVVKKDDNEYVYLFDDKPYKELLKLGLHCLDYRYCDYVDINLTDYPVECFKKTKITDENWQEIDKKDFKIAIIIPNFNYEHTIEKCLNSIFNQTYKNYEIIFVDDMSTDNSVEVAEKTYQKYLLDAYGYYDDTCTKEKMKIVKLKQKRLNGGARNEGYLYVSDDVDYIYYVDSDDWLFDNHSLEKINNKLQEQPDVLFVGIASYKNGKMSISSLPQYKDRYEAITGWSGSCGKVIKKSLAIRQECLYKEGTLKEDRTQHRKICIYMKDYLLLKTPVYVWNQDNHKSVTTIRDEIVWGTSTIRHYADTLELYLSEKGKDERIDNILEEALNKTKKEMENGGDQQW